MSYDKHIFWLRDCDEDELDSELRFARRACRFHYALLQADGTLENKRNFNEALRFWNEVLSEIATRYGIRKRG